MSERKLYLDFLRCIACIGVIQIHVSASNWYLLKVDSLEWQVLNFFDSMVRWCVPIFVMISGTLFLNPQKEISIKTIFTKYVFRIVIVILLFGVLIYLFETISAKKNVWYNLTNLFSYINFYHFWFLYMIIGLYLLTPILKIITKYATKQQFEYCLILLFLFSFLLPLFEVYFSNEVSTIINNLKLPMISGFVFYFLLGRYLDVYNFPYRKTLYVVGLIAVLYTVLGSSYLSLQKGKPENELYANVSIQCFAVSMALFVLLKNNYHRIENIVLKTKLVNIISKYSLGIYGVHVIFISLLFKLGVINTTFNPVVMVPAMVIIVLSLSLLFTILLSKIPFIGRFIL